MRYLANTAQSPLRRLAAAVRLLLAVPPAQAAYSVFIPGKGVVGEYVTVEQAESALRALPCSDRQRATICDADGYCICR